jgi:hypothetical protein
MSKKYSFLILLSAFMISIAYFSCQKAVVKAQENLLYDIITIGRWEVSKFEIGTNSILDEYAGYSFQFTRSGAVTAIKTGEANVEGTWAGNTETLSITSNFPVTTNPLVRFNGVWIITKTTETTVVAYRVVGNETFYLGLKKM